MECLRSIFQIGKSFWGVTGKWFVCLIKIDENLGNLKEKMEKLRSQENDINERLIAELQRNSRKTMNKVVEHWLKEVQKIAGYVQDLEKQVLEERNVFVRAWLGKCILEKIDEVAEKVLEGNGILSDGLVIEITSGWLLSTETFFDGATCQSNKEKVWKHLMDDELRRNIGVHGMGGSGKTTLMKHINNELVRQEPPSFDNVIWVTVSKAFNIREIQDEIAKALELSFSKNDTEIIRAADLLKSLSQRKYLLILDDLWKAFSLAEVGIPEPRTSDNGFKLVITTRLLDVCRKMDCEPVEVELLTEQEELDLFMSRAVQQGKRLAPEVEKIARKVAKKCKRLPLAVITVAESIKGTDVNDIHEWRNALNELNLCDTDVLEVLKFSYTRLNDEKLQNCFLYCALCPEDCDFPKEVLIEYWIAEGLIADMNEREAMFDKGHNILNKLVSTCLLESSTKDDYEEEEIECVRMHDSIREMALKITETRFMVHAGEGLEIVPYEDWSEDLERVSLIQNNIGGLPYGEPPNCPRLVTLLLNANETLSVISDSFFMHMPCLTLLDLSYTGIEFLPDSISNLKSLQGLFLEGCSDLSYVPSLEKLKALKELKMGGCDIKNAPQGIEELANLRYLNLMENENLQTFPSLKLSKLSQLQFLRIDHTKTTVAAEDLLWLRHLKVVRAHLENVQEFLSYVKSEQFQNLEEYHLSVGFFPLIDLEVRFNTGKEFHCSGLPLESGVDTLVLPNNIKLLRIDECDCHVLKSLSDIPSLRDATDLIECHLYRCEGLESIISCSLSEEDCRIPLKSVEILELRELPNLRVLFDGGVIPPQSISFNLKKLTLKKCPRIKNVFPVAKLLHNFPNLVELTVWDCEDVEGIIGEDEEEVTEMSDSGDHNRQNDSNSIIALPNLKILELRELPNLRVQFDGVILPQSISFNLKILKLEKSPRIKNVFPVAKLLQNFPNLVELTVGGCEDVEDIIGGGEEEVTEMSDSGGHNRQNDSNSIIILPNLQRITLFDLPKLKSMYKGKMLCKSLGYIFVFECPMLRRLPNFSVHVDSEQASSSAVAPPPLVLRNIYGQKKWWESLIWNDPQYKSTLEPLFRLGQTSVLKVDIHNDECNQKVNELLQMIEGVYQINIDAKKKEVTVSGSVDPVTLIMKLRARYYAELLSVELWGAGNK